VNELEALRKQVYDLKTENATLQALLDDSSPETRSWLQAKVASQRRALDGLNRRVVSQRFQLRTINGLGRGLTVEEYKTARGAVENSELKDRIDEPVAV
jgi:uncharacterized coiled-coil protein SlyX